MSNRIATAVFDLDGTLVDSLPDLVESGAALLKTYNLPCPDKQHVRQMIGDGVRSLVDRLLVFGGDEGRIDRDCATERFLEIYEPRATLKTRLFSGTEGILVTLKEHGIKCVVCTNKPVRASEEIIEKLGIVGLIDAIGGGDSFAVRKPDPEHVRRTMRLIQAEPANGVMIGDHRNDMQAAMGVPMLSLFASWGYGDRSMATHASAVAGTIHEVPRLIHDLEQVHKVKWN